MNNQSITDRLPGFPDEWMFVHVESREEGGEGKRKTTYKVAVYVENGRLTFLDWNHDDRDHFWNILDIWDVSDAFAEICKKERYDDNKDPGDRPLLDIIVGAGLCARIDTLPESIMYDYELLHKNSRLNAQRHPVNALKLLPYFDQLRPDDSPPRADIETFFRGPNAVSQPTKRQSIEALKLYDKFVAFDAFLDEYAEKNGDQATLTLDDLKEQTDDQNALGDKVRQLFQPRQLTNYYSERGLFGSVRPNELTATYRGIWYTDDDHYVVGGTTGMQSTQAHGQLVRHVVQNAGTLPLETLLALNTVRFVRFEQYTVVPYPFHLLDLFIENILHYKTRSRT